MLALKSLVALSLVSSAFAGCSRNYTVQAGDICDSISKTQSVSTFQLAIANNVVDDACSNLAIGQDLCLGWPGQDCDETYVVASGDSCDAITAAQGLNSTVLFLNNPQIDSACSNIYIGEVLCVSSTVYAYPETVTIASTEAPAYIASADSYENLPWCDDEE